MNVVNELKIGSVTFRFYSESYDTTLTLCTNTLTRIVSPLLYTYLLKGYQTTMALMKSLRIATQTDPSNYFSYYYWRRL